MGGQWGGAQHGHRCSVPAHNARLGSEDLGAGATSYQWVKDSGNGRSVPAHLARCGAPIRP